MSRDLAEFTGNVLSPLNPVEKEVATNPPVNRTADNGQLCPSVEIVQDLGVLSEFQDNARPSDKNMISRVYLNQIESRCEYGPKSVALDVKLAFEAELGKSAKLRQSDRPSFSYPYFVAVVGPDDTILAKEIFAVPVSFKKNEDTHTVYEALRQIIPLRNSYEGQYFTLMAGFQLDDDQLRYNRNMKQR